MNALRSLVRDGFIDLGTAILPGELVVGDPALLGDSNAYWSGRVVAGTWRWMLRIDDASDRVAELVGVLDSSLDRFYELYDAGEVPSALPVTSGRLLAAGAARIADYELRRSALEMDDFPWVMDDGIVGEAYDPAWLFTAGDGDVALIAVAFGARIEVPVGRIPLEN